MSILLICISILFSIQGIFLLIGYFISAPRYKGPISDHFNGKQFLNPDGVKAKGLKEVLKWAFTRKPGKWNVKSTRVNQQPLNADQRNLKITFVNHSTFLIQVDGIHILTDPVWSDRVSPFNWIGPRRMQPAGILLDDLPKIHLILLSHNHYDHLDLPTLHKLYKAHKPDIIVPLGVDKFLNKKGIHVAAAIDWWEECRVSNVSVQAVPAQHFSGRGAFDRDATLWCGFVIKHAQGNVYFAGDSGYNQKIFREIGEKCSLIRIAILPIGAYKPRWFMEAIHTSPFDAVQAHIDLRAEVSIASHFGTFPLADDDESDPILDLEKAVDNLGVDSTKFIALQNGNSYEVITVPIKINSEK